MLCLLLFRSEAPSQLLIRDISVQMALATWLTIRDDYFWSVKWWMEEIINPIQNIDDLLSYLSISDLSPYKGGSEILNPFRRISRWAFCSEKLCTGGSEFLNPSKSLGSEILTSWRIINRQLFLSCYRIWCWKGVQKFWILLEPWTDTHTHEIVHFDEMECIVPSGLLWTLPFLLPISQNLRKHLFCQRQISVLFGIFPNWNATF